MRRFLSYYHPQFVRSLIYMLQASEYHIGDYLSWFGRVKDFRKVENRKHLVFTKKAFVFLVLGYMGLALFYALLLFLSLENSMVSYGILIFTILVFPWALVYGLTLPLLLFSFLIQRPLEFIIVRKAARKLKNHGAVRIAIAGSYGKTTMREILRTVLSAGKRAAAPPASYNTPLGIARFIQGLRGDEEVLIFELGEYYPGDVATLCHMIIPDIGIITGINEAHLEKFKTLEKTADTIFELASFVPAEKLYVNGENALAKKRALPGNILYSRAGIRDWRIINETSDLEGTRFTLMGKNDSKEMRSALLGLHQIGPLLVAAEIASGFGLPLETIELGIRQTQPFSHRLEKKKDPQGVIILDDSYNGNPDGVEAVIEFLTRIKGKRRWYVTPGLVEMGQKTKPVHIKIGKELAKSGIEKIALIRTSVTPYIEEGLRNAGYTEEIHWFDSMPHFLVALPQLTLENDVILLQNDWPDQYA